MEAFRQSPVGPLSPPVATLVAIVLVGVTLFAGWRVRKSVRSQVRESLQTVLAANVTALRLWLEQQRDWVSHLAADPAIRRAALARLDGDAASEPDAESIISAEQLRRLRDAGYLDWILADRLGIVVAASDDSLLGQHLPLQEHRASQLAAGRATVSLPFEWQTESSAGGSPQSTAVMCAMAPLGDSLEHQGLLALTIDPGGEFTDILSVARLGESGETYAFDRQATLLSRSRFESQLRTLGLLGDQQSSPLNLQIRDPRTAHHRRSVAPDSSAEESPLTEMAEMATRGGEGENLAGYDDYRGVPVVGAWRWLADYGFGVVTEQDVEEAYRPLRILRNYFFALLGLVATTAGSLLAFAWVMRPKRRADRLAPLNRRLGQYRLDRVIGRGGMGTVYLGFHELLDRPVAIKVLENTDATDEALLRFQREVQLTARLQHPNTIEIYDFGRTDEGTFFYVMELVDGISLDLLIEHYGRQPAERVIYLLLQICGSIAEAHQAGLIHRDIKPANVVVTSRSGIHDLVKVLDFGLAKQVGRDTQQLTRADTLTGTPHYMAPESIRDASSVGVLSDIYSIGAVGYSLLCGVPPFEADTPADVCALKLYQEPPRPDRRIHAPIADDIQEVLMECLHRTPGERPATVTELASRLLACSNSPRWTQRDAGLWWTQVFDGPSVLASDVRDLHPGGDADGQRPVTGQRPPVASPADPTVN
ncbi:serine/threonine protein kinase [Roseiconus nitratireducens]|nr:serine/threonine protein kinase [Roseiconus nitratireducens]